MIDHADKHQYRSIPPFPFRQLRNGLLVVACVMILLAVAI